MVRSIGNRVDEKQWDLAIKHPSNRRDFLILNVCRKKIGAQENLLENVSEMSLAR